MKKNIKKISIIIGIIILPIIYSLCYLNGFWDPYNSLDKVKVALVNNDECKENCKGNDLINKLKENKTFDFKEVSEKQADQGLINKKYYATIKIPKDFSNNLNNIDKTNRKQTTIEVITNTKTSYIISQIISSATKEITKELNSNINEELTKKLTGKIYEIPNQTQKISDGFSKLNDGTKSLKTGTETLSNGSSLLYKNYKQFDQGTKTLSNGTNELNTKYQQFNISISKISEGTHTLKTKADNLEELTNGIEKLQNGSNTLNTNFQNYKNLSDDMLNNTDDAYLAIINYANNHPDALIDNDFQTAYIAANKYHSYILPSTNATIIETLKSSNNSLSNGINDLNNGIILIYNQKDDLTKLKLNINELDNYLKQLKNASEEITNGINKINNGAEEISQNSTKIKNGINDINNGTKKLQEGTKKLNNSVNNAKDELDQKITETKTETKKLKGLSTYAKNPTKITETNYGNVNDYGTFFSPYFISLSIWVGGILILVGLYYDPDERIKILGRNSNNKKLRLLLYNIIGIIQALALGFILKTTLGFTVTSIPLYYLSCILISEVFLSIIIFLFFYLGDIGKFLGIVFLVVQLASCGGTFPVETEPTFYQTIYPYTPMTYSVNLLRESFVTINNTMLKDNILVLIIIFIIFTSASLIFEFIKNKKSIKI